MLHNECPSCWEDIDNCKCVFTTRQTVNLGKYTENTPCENLIECVIDGADMRNNTITVKLPSSVSVRGIILGGSIKIQMPDLDV
jgi:hypothetical protein